MYCQWNSFEACFKLRFLEPALSWAISAACPSWLHHQGLLRLGWKAQSTWFTCLNGPGISSWLKPWFMWQKRASYSKLVIHYTEKWLLWDPFTLCLSSLRKKCFKDLMLPSRVQAWCCLKGIRAVEFRKSVLKNIFPWKCIILSFSLKLEVIYSKDKNEALDDGIGIFFSIFITSLVLCSWDSTAWNCSKEKCRVKIRCWNFIHFKVWTSSKIKNLSRYWAVLTLLLTNHFPHQWMETGVAHGDSFSSTRLMGHFWAHLRLARGCRWPGCARKHPGGWEGLW